MTESIEELAKRKIELIRHIERIGMINVSGRKNEDLIAISLDEIKSRKELFDIESKIETYIRSGGELI
jgi:hypothetical protein